MILDSHVLVWFLLGDAKLGKAARRRIEATARRQAISVSSLSFCEIGVKIVRGKISGLSDTEAIRNAAIDCGVEELAPDGTICMRAAHLTHALSDSFDALITATAIERGLHLVTADERILGWKGPLRCLDARR